MRWNRNSGVSEVGRRAILWGALKVEFDGRRPAGKLKIWRETKQSKIKEECVSEKRWFTTTKSE